MNRRAVRIVCLVCALSGLVNPSRGQLSGETPFAFGENGELSLDVWGGRDLNAALSVAHLARDVVGFRIRANIRMGDMLNLPVTPVARDISISGVSGNMDNESQKIIDAGNCETRLRVEPGVKLVVKFLEVDVRKCLVALEGGAGDRSGLPEWLFQLGIGSELVHKDVTIVLTSAMLKEIEHNAGHSISENVPQNVLLKSKDGSNRAVAFRNVVFSVKGGTSVGNKGGVQEKNKVVEREKTPVIRKVNSEKQLKKALLWARPESGLLEVWVQNNISFSDRPLFSNRFGRGAKGRGMAQQETTDISIKSGEGGVATLGWPSSFLTSSIFLAPGTGMVSLENVQIDSHEFLPPMPSCFSEDCLRLAWAAFPSISGGYQCKFLVKNVTIGSSCQSIRNAFQTFMFANFWKGRTLEEVQNISYEVPYVKMDRIGDELLRVHAFARKGLCMEDVLVKCRQPLLLSTPSTGYHRVQESSGTSIVFLVSVSLGLLGLLLCVIRICGRGGRGVPRVRWMMGSKASKAFNHSQSSGSMTGSLHTSYITASSMPVPSEPVCPLPDRTHHSQHSMGSHGVHGSVNLSEGSRDASPGGQVTQKCLDWENNVVQIEEQIGVGGYGIVYRGRWKHMDVAVKTVDFQDCPSEKGKQRRRAILEASISASVAHRNIVQTLAYCFKPIKDGAPKPKVKLIQRRRVKKGRKWKMYIVQEYCDAGSLRAALRQRVLQNSVVDRTVNFNRVLGIALDIARGMEHLHSNGIIHGDLTSKNIMLRSGNGSSAVESGADLTAKIGDFGLSVKVRNSEATVYNHRAGTPFYIAPEVYHDGLLSKRADVYSFGVLLWELYHQRAPFEKKPEGGYRYHHRFPKFPVHCPMPYALLCVICLSPRMKERPGFSFVKGILEQMLDRENEWRDHDKMEQENTRLSAELEGQSVSELQSFVARLLGDVDEQSAHDVHSPVRDSGSERANSSEMAFTQVSQDRMRFRSNIVSLTLVAGSELSMRNGDWERRVEEIIASGMPLSVTVLPPETGTSDSGTGNWSGSRSQSQSLSKTDSRGSDSSSRSSRSGGLHPLSLTIQEEMCIDQSLSSCGELKFRWSPDILASQEAAHNKGEPSDNRRPRPVQDVRGNHEIGEKRNVCVKDDGVSPIDVDACHIAVQIMSSGDIDSNEKSRQDREDEDRLLRLALPPTVSRGATEFQLEPRAVDGEIDGEFDGIENGFQGRCWLDWDEWEDSSTELMFEYTSPPEGVFNGIYLSQNPLFSLSPREG